MKRRRFKPLLLKGQSEEQWVKVGVVKAGEVLIHFTSSSLALSEEGLGLGAQELRERIVTIPHATPGQIAFIRAVSPYEVALCVADRGSLPAEGAKEMIIRCEP